MQLLTYGGLAAYSQTPEELRKQADLLFEQGKFVEATPLYSKILAQQPRDYDINFRYGTCLLYNSHNKEEAIRYLNYSVKGPDIDKRAFYYLGRAYHLNYQFNEAIIQYEKFKSVGNPALVKSLEVDQQILACKNGKKLLSNLTDMIVIQKTEIRAEDFYEIYKLNNIGGTILVTDEFQSKMDKQKGHRAVIHFPANSQAIYYSSYGDDGSTGLDIYVKRKLPDGRYSEGLKVQGGVNTGMDENFPYMHPDGKYLYFCSKGHNSMGGYDVFRAAYDPNTNTFGQAENMDFAISSPDDDIFFVVDSLDRNAYFASARESQNGKLFVYEVRVDRIPLQIAVIKGNFVNSINVSNKVVSIEIIDFSTGESIGTFNSKESNGDYLITFPKPGKYKYMIQVKGSEETHVATIEIPYQKEFKPLKQRITVSRDDMGQEFVNVENLFGEEFDDPVSVMAEIYKNMAELMPNSGKYNIDSLDKIGKQGEVFEEVGLDAFVTKAGVEQAVNAEVNELNTAIAEDEKNAAIAYNLAEQKSDSANAMMVIINQNIQLAENTTDPTEKSRILNDVYDDTKKVEQLNTDSKNLVELGKTIDQSIAEKKEDLQEAKAVQEDLKTVPEGDKTVLGNVVTENKNFFVENVKNNAPHENVVEEIVNANATQANTTQKINSDIATLRKEQLDLESKNVKLQQQLDNTSNKKEKAVLQQQILDNENRIEELKMQIQQKEKEYDAAINSGGNSNLGNAAQIVENPRNATADNIKPLSQGEKDAIGNKVTTNNLDENLAAVNKILDENNVGGPAINLFASDATTRNYTLQQWTDAIDQEIDRLNTLKMNATGEERIKIEQDIQRYEELRENKIKEFNIVEDPTKIQPQINPNDVVTGYTTRQNEINRIPDEGQRRTENLALNEQLKNELLDEKAKLEKLLDENPGSKNIEERIANIDKIIASTDVLIAEDKKWLAQNAGTVVVDTKQVVASVDPGYQASINQIYKTTDPSKREAEIKLLNESFTEKSSERLQELEARVQSNPNDAVAKAELDELKRLNQQITSDPTQPLIKPVVYDLATVNPKVTPDQIMPDYTARKADIAKISDDHTQKTAENVLNKELSNGIRTEIKNLEDLLADNPGNAAITERIANLKKLDDQVNSSIVANDQWLAANPKTTDVVVDPSDVKLVNTDYQEKVDSINAIQDPNQQKTAIRDLNATTVEKIDERIAELDKKLAQNPNDQAALDEKAELTQMKSQLQNDPDKTLTQPTDYANINTKPTVAEIMPDYQQKLDGINGSSESTTEKEKDKIELNQNLVSLIDTEIKTLTDAKTAHPEAAKNIDKRIAGLNTIKAQKEGEIKASENKIAGSTTATGPAITLKDVMPDYDQKMADIEKKDINEKTELTEKNAVNAELIGKIDTKLASLEAEKAKNPANMANINRDIQVLENLKTQKQNEINQNNDRIEAIDSGTAGSRPAITANTVLPGYDQKMADIDQKNITEKSKLEEKNALNNQLIAAVDKKITELEKEKAANPANAAAIDKDIQTLQDLKTQKQNEIAANNQRINDLNNGTASTRPAITANSIMPGYDTNMAAINQKSTDEKARLNDQNTLNNQLLTAADKKIADLEKEKLANPSNAAAIDKDIQTVQNIKSQKQNEINLNNQRITDLNNGTTRPAITANSIMPGYDTNMAAINQKSTDEKAKLNDQNALNNQLLTAADKKIADLEKEKVANPGNAAAIDKDIQTVQNIKNQKQNEISLNNQRIADLNNGTSSSRPAISINSIMPGYEPGMAAIDQKSTDEKTKLLEKNALTNQLISAIDTKIAELEQEKLTNPANAAAIDKDIQTLKNIKSQKQNEINQNNDRIEQLNSGTTSTRPVLTISAIMPDYDSKMAAIEKKNLDEKSELTEKNGVNNQLITAIDSKITQLETEKANNPGNAAAIDKDIQTLQNIKSQKQNEINLNNERIAQLESGDTTSRPVMTISSIMPDYDKKMAAIEKKNLDEKSELTEKNGVNNQLITAIDTKIGQLETEKTNNPGDAAAIDKDIQSLQNIKSQKQDEINLNNERIEQLNSGSTSSRPEITANTLLPGYDQKMTAIDQKSADEKIKLQEKNTLNTQLIAAIDKKTAELEKEKKNNPSQAAEIDKDIQSLQNLKTQKQSEINANNQRISDIENGTTTSRPTITINSLMPEYEPGIARIENGSQSEQEKLIAKNKLHQQLIGAIDAKIAQLNNELKTNPANAALIQQDIDKLQELKEAKRAEIDKNNNLLSSMGVNTTASVKSVTETNTSDFTSDEGKNVIAGHEADITEIKNLDNDIADLENQLANTTNPGEQAKLEKQIDKKEMSQARLENEVLEDLGAVNQTEFRNLREATVTNGDLTTGGTSGDESITEANNNIREADALMNEATQLRNEAANEKDPIIANQKLEKAFENEQRATDLLNDANLTYKTAAVIDQLGGNDKTVITSVPENPSDRQSAELLDQAAQLDMKANELNAQAQHLRDSSTTVKKKYREALVTEAQQLDSLANVYRTEANDLKTQAADLKSQEDAITNVLPQSNDKQVDNETVTDVIATSDYKNYYDAKTIGDSNMFRAEEFGNDIAALQERKERKIKEAIVTYGTGPELEKALANDPEYQDIQNDLDSLQKLQEQYRDRAIASYQNAENVLDKTDPEMRDNILAISDRDLVPVEKIVVNVNPIEADFKAPEQLNSSIFRTTNDAVYSNVKPIPVDQQQPSGLVYKVQVGAFRQPLPPEYFDKFAPISGQKIGDGITRYMVGYFTNFTLADNSKEQVHDLGYNDAFVVAYCNGTRISLQEAKEIEAGRKECPGTNLIAVNNMNINQSGSSTVSNTQSGNQTNTQGGNTAGSTQITPTTDTEKQLTSYYTSVPDAAKANQVEIIKGLFFTVQIGVYSKPVKASLLYNIQPLNSQLTEDNKIRYTTGIYCNVEDASKRKNEIVGIGITDAFVTAYYNGKRITLTEANNLLGQNGSSILFDCAGAGNQLAGTSQNTSNQGGTTTTNQGGTTTNQGGNMTNQGGNMTNQGGTTTTNQGGNTTNQGGTTTTNQGGNTTNQGGTTPSNQGGNTLTYAADDTTGLWRVRVGYFKDQVPPEFIELLLNHQDEGIVSASDGDENMTFYTIPFTDRPSAEQRAEDLRDKGFKQAGIEKMPGNVDELGNTVTVPSEPKEVFYKEGVYYRLVIGKYANEIPGEFATILLQTENILETEVDADGNTYIMSTKIEDMATVRERLVELNELGVEDMEIVTYYKYDPIPYEQGEQILQEKPLAKLTFYDTPRGISADPYLYNKDAIYFRVDLGQFEKEVPQEFANLMFENRDENILKEETFEGQVFFYTVNFKTYEEAEATYKRLVAKGFKDAKIVAFHKYDDISIQKAREILAEQ